MRIVIKQALARKRHGNAGFSNKMHLMLVLKENATTT